MKNNKQKLFTALVLESSIEDVITGLPGWSHQGETSTRSVTYYPFEQTQRRIFFFAKHRTAAVRQLVRIPFSSPQSITEWCAEPPARTVARKAQLASDLCRKETFLGDFSRFDFYRKFATQQKALRG